MGEVVLLDDGVINRIAAGEVVERPASVVKELVENALDAGARNIWVELKYGGRTHIAVADDGRGMTAEDARLAVRRHATSKIRAESDLETVATLGFRGEALASIAAVSRFELRTRRHHEDLGASLRIDGGQAREPEPCGCPAGTEVRVRDLFYNVPARQKFLRTQGTELNHAVEAVRREALARPDVAFFVDHQGRRLLSAPVNESVGDRVGGVLGIPDGKLIQVAFDQGGLKVEAYLAMGTKPTSGGMRQYVNGRFVRDPVLRRAVNEAFEGHPAGGRPPAGVLYLQLDPRKVDVNVHPAKTEVRFLDPWGVVRNVAEGLRVALETRDGPSGEQGPLFGEEAPVPSPASQASSPTPQPPGPAAQPQSKPVLPPPAHPDDDPRLPASTPSPEPSPAGFAAEAQLPPPEPPPPGGLRRLQPLGVLAERWMLAQDDGQLVALDLRAALQELAAARIRADQAEGGVPKRRLPVPHRAEISADHRGALLGARDRLAELGFDVDEASGGVATIAVPALIPAPQVEQVAARVGRALATGQDPVEGLAACAVKEPPRTPYELRALLASLDEAGVRPRIARLDPDELDRRAMPE